jgi:5-methylthioadenosine/S-adenosylhomocysteine deaminase
MATREGARYAGIDAGVLEPGSLADLVVIELERPHLRPLHEAVSTLVYHADHADVAMTVVDGRIVYEDGRCTLVDEHQIRSEAQRRGAELAARAGIVPRP